MDNEPQGYLGTGLSLETQAIWNWGLQALQPTHRLLGFSFMPELNTYILDYPTLWLEVDEGVHCHRVLSWVPNAHKVHKMDL